MSIFISPRVSAKLEEKHGVTEEEIRQCFLNIPEGYTYIRDVREQHETDPPTVFFIAETNRRRKLKVCFIARPIKTPNGDKVRIDIKTAYPPDESEIENYETFGKENG